jgi:spore maturation protein SpmA
LFGVTDQKTASEISLSLSANMLGIGGIATPSAIESMRLMDEKQNEKGKLMLFVISSTSIQILPLSVMQLLTEYGSNNPSIIFLPTLFATVFSTILGVVLVKVFC